VNSYIYITYFS